MHCQISFAMRSTAGRRAVMLCEFKLEGLNVSSFIYWQYDRILSYISYA